MPGVEKNYHLSQTDMQKNYGPLINPAEAPQRGKALILVILLIWLAAGAMGCHSLAQVILPGGMGGGAAGEETPLGQAYFHYLRAQRLLLAEDIPGAIKEYEVVLEHDPDAVQVMIELAAL